MTRWRVLVAAALLEGLHGAPARAQVPALPEPPGYRMDHYRSPVPATLDGRPALRAEDAERMWRDHAAVFVDTLPQAPKPANLPAGTLWHRTERRDIPGSIWLPDTGYGLLPPAMASYFAENLERATHGDHAIPIVFYCLADCWMSWNAAKRAETLGYTHVFWFSQGTDGWEARGLPLDARTPQPRPGEAPGR